MKNRFRQPGEQGQKFEPGRVIGSTAVAASVLAGGIALNEVVNGHSGLESTVGLVSLAISAGAAAVAYAGRK